MYSKNPRTTAYSEFVFYNLPLQLIGRAGAYNYAELAEMVGLKPTGNFKRRVKQLVANGRVDAIAAFSSRGGIEARFTAHVEDFMKEEAL